MFRNYPIIIKAFQSPIGWGLSCEAADALHRIKEVAGFNPLLVGV
jgi:hypothetical protein